MGIKKILKSILGVIRPVNKTVAMITYTAPDNRLKGMNIIITGGGRGLGAAMAEKFVNEGANILIAGRNENTLKETANKVGCQYLVLDVADVASFDTFLDNAELKIGKINGLVNNAGISLHESTFFDVTPETFDSQVSVNMRGGYFLTQKLAKRWLDNSQKGNVLFISSETGDMMDFRPYGFTKVAVNSMVQGLAYLFAKQGIRINAVAPGVTMSDMTGERSTDNIYYSRNMLGRVYMPEEVAETACFLMSEVSGCISGQIITCNNAKSINARWK